MKTLLMTAALMMSATGLAAQTCPATGPEGPGSLHADWIMEGWERREGDPDFVFATKMARYYDLTDTDGVFYDNFAPGESQLFRDASVYGANWEGLQNAAKSVLHGLTGANEELIGTDVASTTLGFVGQIDRLDGQVIAFEGRSQLGWACVDGTWKIKHELNYAWIVEPETIAATLGKRVADE